MVCTSPILPRSGVVSFSRCCLGFLGWGGGGVFFSGLTQDQAVGAITAGFTAGFNRLSADFTAGFTTGFNRLSSDFTAGFNRLSMLILLAQNPLANEYVCHYFSPPSFDPDFWANSPVSCYGYALNDPAQHGGDPGDYGNGSASSAAGSFEISKDIFLGFVQRDLEAANVNWNFSSSSTAAVHGHYLVALFLSWSESAHKAYYHFIRQDADNNWSHKPRNDIPIQQIAFSESMTLAADQDQCTYTIAGYFHIPNNGVILRQARSAPASTQSSGQPSERV